MKNEDLFFMYRDISALFDDFLSCGRQDEIEQRGYDRGVFFGYNNSIAGVRIG